jgi:NAD(P)-dependent dehydrogenase (short-subunit alcohol dehydrogenase family)
MAQQRVAIVTGGARGIGKGIAARLLADGWAVVIADCDADAGAETAAVLADCGTVRFVHADVAVEDDVRRIVAAAGEGLDLLVNNAGIGIGAPVTELTLDAWNRVLATNLTGAFLCAKHAASALAARGGAIVNIASTRALMSEPNTEAYAASKGGLLALTHALAVSLGPRVRVHCISPGWINVRGETFSEADHAQHPAGRVGTPEDIAALVVFLAGPESGFITGQNFVVDGGMTVKMIYE